MNLPNLDKLNVSEIAVVHGWARGRTEVRTHLNDWPIGAELRIPGIKCDGCGEHAGASGPWSRLCHQYKLH